MEEMDLFNIARGLEEDSPSGENVEFQYTLWKPQRCPLPPHI